MRLCSLILTAALFLMIVPVAGQATPLEDAYIAARDRYIEKFKPLEWNDDVAKQHDAALHDLEKQLQRIIGPVSIKGFSGRGKINLQSLVQEEGFGMMDGLVFDNAPNSTTTRLRVFVTTRNLIEIWLHNRRQYLLQEWLDLHPDPQMSAAFHNRPPEAAMSALVEQRLHDHPEIPQTLERALTSDLFYVELFESGAAAMKFTDVPIMKPENADFAAAIALVHEQDYVALAPDEIFVSVIKGDHVFVAGAPVTTKVPQIPACSAPWNKRRRSAPGAESKEAEAYAAFLQCFGQQAKTQRFFPALVKQAQELGDLLAK
jgi:hypothetical protein